MKEYEVSIYTRANSVYIPNRYVEGLVVSAKSKKQACEFAYELYRANSATPLSRECLRIEVEKFNG